MSYKTIDETFWTDPTNKKGWSPQEKLIALYLITNPHTHYSGIYYLPKVFIANETGLPLKTINKFFAKHPRFSVYDDIREVVWVKNMARHQIKQGNRKNLIVGIANQLKTLHNSPLIKDFLNHYRPLEIPFDIPSEWDREPIAESETVTEEEKEIYIYSPAKPRLNGKSRMIREIINYCNKKWNTNYRITTKKTIALIESRLKEGFTVEDFKTVIDKKTKQWRDDPKMALFLRPITLFGTKFECYLNETEVDDDARFRDL